MSKQETKITVTGKQALGYASPILKWAMQKIKGFSNRTLIAKAAKQIDEFQKQKIEEQNELISIYGKSFVNEDGIENYKVDEIALRKLSPNDWTEYKKKKDNIENVTITIEAFSKRLDVEMNEDDLNTMHADELTCLDMFLNITPISTPIDWKAKFEAAQKQLDEIATKAKG